MEKRNFFPLSQAQYTDFSQSQISRVKRKTLLTVSIILFFSVVFSFLIYWFIKIEFGHSPAWDNVKDWFDKDKPIRKFQPDCIVTVRDEDKVDCHPDSPASEEECLNRGCCWKLNENMFSNNVPSCYYPSNYVGYKVKTIKKSLTGISALLTREIPSGFPKDVKNANISVYFYDRSTVRIRITDVNNSRFEVPYPEKTRDISGLYGKWGKPLYTDYAVFLRENGKLVVKRLSNRQTVFNTDLTRMVFSDQFLQLSTHLSTSYVYGLGQNKGPLLKNAKWSHFTLFNRDRTAIGEDSSFGTHPFYLALEKSGNSHGVVLFNSNAMDIDLRPSHSVTFRPIGGIFDFFIFFGPQPDSVIQQYSKITGTTFMPPYWSLGHHLSSSNSNSLDESIKVLTRNRDAGIPIDAYWNNINYMQNQNSFTYDKVKYNGLPKHINQLHDIGLHYITTIDPGISNTETPGTYLPYDDGVKMGIFVKNNNGQILLGKGRSGNSVVFPDFSHPKVTDYWTKQFQDFYSDIKFDGVLLGMNEPSDFYNEETTKCLNSSYKYPQYLPRKVKPLNFHTLCMDSKHYISSHYNLHNLYGYMEALTTYKALNTTRQKRPFVISRSSFPGLGHYAGVWDADINSNWNDMKLSIPSMLSFNMFGIPMVGADICGFSGNATAELCARWSALGSFYPFSRNLNARNTVEQHPVALGLDVVTAAKNSLTTRYLLLPYLYTLFYKSYIFGKTVARPLFFEYPADPNTYNIDEQFLWGKSLMIIPVLYPNVSKARAYFPQDIWYDFHTNKEYASTGTFITVDIPNDSVNLAIRGGSVIPGQVPASTTTKSRLNNFYLIVALNASKMAKGELYWDDGESLESLEKEHNFIKFEVKNDVLTIHPVIAMYQEMPNLGLVKVLGCEEQPKSVNVNDTMVPFDYQINEKVLLISNLSVSLLQTNSIIWSF